MKERVDLVRGWLRKAASDVEIVKLVIPRPPVGRGTCFFHFLGEKQVPRSARDDNQGGLLFVQRRARFASLREPAPCL